jgi:hypothetical protein
MYEKISDIDKYLSKYKEIKYYTISVKDNSVNIAIQLQKKADRKKDKLLSVFELEKLVSKDMEVYENK